MPIEREVGLAPDLGDAARDAVHVNHVQATTPSGGRRR